MLNISAAFTVYNVNHITDPLSFRLKSRPEYKPFVNLPVYSYYPISILQMIGVHTHKKKIKN